MRGKILHLRAATETEALTKAFSQCGSDAVIGEIAEVRKPGIAGLLGRKEVEVSVRIKETTPVPDTEIEKFRGLVNRIGDSIRSEQNAGYLKQWQSALEDFDICGSLAKKIVAAAGGKPLNPETLAKALASSVQVARPSNRVLALVGPTGAGKTTTIAKLAGINAYQYHKKAAIISMDTFRIGAVEQLRTYSRIMGIPLTVISSSGELKEALVKYAKYDRVYIDTAGRSPDNQLSIAELSTILAGDDRIEIALVVSATTKAKDLFLAKRGFDRLNLASVIFTKVDETTSLGSAITFIHQSGLPLAYLGTGQGVPQDIALADSDKVADLIVSRNRTVGLRIG